MKKAKEILEFCTAKDINRHPREWMHEPMKEGDFAYATDSVILVKIPLEDVAHSLSIPFSIRNSIDATFKNNQPNSEIDIGIEDIKAITLSIPTVYETVNSEAVVECDECEGDGEVEWSYRGFDKSFDCPYCDGAGRINSRTNVVSEIKTPDPSYIIPILKSYFSAARLNDIAHIAELCESDKITLIFSGEENKPAIFKIKEMFIALAPLLYYKNGTQHITKKLA